MNVAMPSPGAVLESALYVDDLDAAEAFYGGLLGLERITRAGNRHVFFRCGPGIVLLFRAEETSRPSDHATMPVPPHGTTGPGHLCFAMDEPALSELAKGLEAAGVAIESDFNWPNGARSVYVRDPAGNSVEFAEPKLWEQAL